MAGANGMDNGGHMKHDESKSGTVLVVTRTKDRPVLLRRAMESVLGQTRGDWLHAVVNDGGDPTPVDLLAAEFAGRYLGRLRVFHNAKPTGMQNASNLAIRATESEYVAIHDDDDTWEPTFLEKTAGRLEELGAEGAAQGAIAHTQWIFEEIDAHGRVVELYRREFPAPETIKLAEVAGENRFPPIAFLYRRKAHEAIGYFNEEFTVLGDWDFNLRFLSRFEIAVVPEKLARWHWRHQGGGTAYGNSCTAGVTEHKEKEARLYNHYLRQDLESGRAGLGHLMNVARPLAQLAHQVAELRGRAEQGAGAAAGALAHAEHLNRITRDLARLWGAKEWARRGVAIVRERRGRAGEAAPAGRDVRGELRRAVEGLKPGDVLSLDVFDTALLRVLRHPKDLFAWIEPEAQAALGRPGYPFAQARAAAERVARDRHERDGVEDVTLEQIYGALAEMAGVDAADAARAMELEVEAERRLSYANPHVLEAARAAARRGARVAFASDMYLPAGASRELLAANGYEAPDIFVSSEAGKTKHSGGLFEEMLGKLGCAPERMLHVGDHPESDDARPARMGIRTLLLDRRDYGPAPLADQHAALTGTGRLEVASSVYTGLTRRKSVMRGSSGEVWDRLGYEVAGPMACAFAGWVAERARAAGVKRLYFLARDGHLLEKTFRACAERGEWGVEPIYAYSSRRLLNVARIERLDEAAFHFLLTADPFLRARDFLERIGLPAEEMGADAAREGFGGLDEVVTTREGYFRTPGLRDAMRRLLAGREDWIMARAKKERETLLAYYADIGLVPGPVAVVDLGWQASSVRSVQDLLRRSAPDFALRGYYFGTWRAAQAAADAGCLLESFFCHLGLPERRAGLLAECVELLEHLFTAPHATVVGLERAGGGGRPVCGERETTPEQRQSLERVAAGAMEFAADLGKVDAASMRREAPLGYLESVLERVLRHPTRAEAEAIGALPHRDSFGGAAPWRHLAKVPSAGRSIFAPGSVREAYARAYWKSGFMAQLGPTERGMAGG